MVNYSPWLIESGVEVFLKIICPRKWLNFDLEKVVGHGKPVKTLSHKNNNKSIDQIRLREYIVEEEIGYDKTYSYIECRVERKTDVGFFLGICSSIPVGK